MSKTIIPFSAAVVIVAAVAATFRASHQEAVEERAEATALHALQIHPSAGHGMITAERFTQVDVEYKLTNTGNRTLVNLKPALGCSCQVTQEAASTLEPGTSTILGFSVPADHVGIRELRVALTAEGWATPVAVLTPRINVQVFAPMVVRSPKVVRFSAVSDRPHETIVQIETIEKIGAKPALESLELEMDGATGITALPIRETPGIDNGLCNRVYQFRLRVNGLPHGNHTGVLRPRSSSASIASGIGDIPVVADVQPRLSVVPAEIDLSSDTVNLATKRVAVVDRTGGHDIRVGEYDSGRLRVTRIANTGSSTQLFDIARVESTTTELPRMTVAFVAADGSASTELHVQLDVQENGHNDP